MTRVIRSSKSQYSLPSTAMSTDNSSRLGVAPRSGSINIPVPERRPPLKSSSSRVGRVSILPMGHDTRDPQPGSSSSTPSKKRNLFRAAESGKSDVLPTSMSSPLTGTATNRLRSMSSCELRWSSRNLMSSDQKQAQVQSLRSRRKVGDSPVSGSLDGSIHQIQKTTEQPWNDSGQVGRTEKPLRPTGVLVPTMKRKISKSSLFQIFVVLVVTCLVCDSYRRAVTTSQKLEKISDEESLLMLHLQRLEQQALQLHDNLGRINEGTRSESATGRNLRQREPLDADLIRVQTEQLQQMEEELSVELRSLQTKLQQTARNSIIETYGDGPVQVEFELELEGQNRIAILLWYDTPYAAWALLQQIRRGLWRGSKFKLGRGFSLFAAPNVLDSETKLEFIEKSQKKHEAMTVGLVQNEGGGISLFINLQDNTLYHRYDVCIGKVIDGFDALKRVVDTARSSNRMEDMISVKKASATHLKRSQSTGLI